ncbi:uncharacterized protein LOC141910486 [Tubulanus polymorphus]|uniref:uncharacterized protein LOC141910486 n=1 Tax=Tubulanus polymorphus TaxID=672921 RepID=UPI003DA6054E
MAVTDANSTNSTDDTVTISHMLLSGTWQNAVWYTFNIYIYFWMVTGVTGGLLSAVVMFRLRRTLDACTFQYLVPLAFSDSIYVVTFSLKSLERIHIVVGTAHGVYVFYTVNDFTCKFGMVLNNFGIKTSTRILSCFAVERSIAVLVTLRVGRLMTQARRRNVIVSVFLYHAVTESAQGVTYRIKTIGLGLKNCQMDTVSEVVAQINVIYSYTTVTIIPWVGLIFSTVLIATQFARRDVKFKNKNTSEQERRCVRNLICIIIAFFVFNAPITVLNLVYFTCDKLRHLPNPIQHLFYLIGGVFMITNSAVNFFIYIANLKSFRDELVRIVKH